MQLVDVRHNLSFADIHRGLLSGRYHGYANDFTFLSEHAQRHPDIRLIPEMVNEESFGIAIRKGLDQDMVRKIHQSVEKFMQQNPDVDP